MRLRRQEYGRGGVVCTGLIGCDHVLSVGGAGRYRGGTCPGPVASGLARCLGQHPAKVGSSCVDGLQRSGNLPDRTADACSAPAGQVLLDARQVAEFPARFAQILLMILKLALCLLSRAMTWPVTALNVTANLSP